MSESRSTIAERLAQSYRRLAQLPAPKSAAEALGQISATLEQVEDELSGIVKQSPPPPIDQSDGRMYPPLADMILTKPDGSVVARTRGHTLEIGSDGSVTIHHRRTGNILYSRKGGGS